MQNKYIVCTAQTSCLFLTKTRPLEEKLGTQSQQFVVVWLDNALALLFSMEAPIVSEGVSFDVMQFHRLLLFFFNKTI